MALNIGSASVVTGFQDLNSAVVNFTSALDSASRLTNIIDGFTDESGTESGKLVSGLPNDLEEFASYTYLWTLACLSPQQFNDPASYRNDNDLTFVVFSSAGRYDQQRTNFSFGAPEYFVDNMSISSVIAASEKTGNSNAIGFKWEVYEPYSMGLFLQNLQLSALDAGHVNYLKAPYVLKLDFRGYKDDGTIYEGIKPRYFTLKLSKVTFDVDEGGSRYQVEAFPYNHQGFSDVINRTYNDVAFYGETVIEALQTGPKSLAALLNQSEADSVAAKKINQADQYEIHFPINYSERLGGAQDGGQSGSAQFTPGGSGGTSVGGNKAATGDFGSNSIGAADFGFTLGSGGNMIFQREGDVVDENSGKVRRNQMVINPKLRQFQFEQGQSLTAIITQMILSSRFATEALKIPPTPEGFIRWFKIDVQIELLEFDDSRGDYAKKIIYRVVPYNVHINIFSSPDSVPPGYKELEKRIGKKYNYIYTGQNNDLLKFDIKINNLFYTALNPKPEQQSGPASNVDQKGPVEENPLVVEKQEGAAPNAQFSNTGGKTAQKSPDNLNIGKNPTGGGSSEELVARAFQQAFLNNSGDLINMDIEVLGDLYWVADSGIGNYFSPPAGGGDSLVTEDGTVNYEGGDVYIYISLRTPTDVNEYTGLYDFPNGGKESPFSGIYKVTKCENTFSDGIFKQRINCFRMPYQASDFEESQSISSASTAAIKFGPEDVSKAFPFLDTIPLYT